MNYSKQITRYSKEIFLLQHLHHKRNIIKINLKKKTQDLQNIH